MVSSWLPSSESAEVLPPPLQPESASAAVAARCGSDEHRFPVNCHDEGVPFFFVEAEGAARRHGMSSHTDARSRSGQSTVTVSVAVDRPAMMAARSSTPFAPIVFEGQRNRRQSGSQVGRDELLIVESDDGNVVGDAQSALLDRVVRAHRHAVVGAEDRGGRVGEVEKSGCRGVAAVGGRVSGDLEILVG